jgi:hypothetical protein
MRSDVSHHKQLAFIGSAGATNFSRAEILKALSITPFEGSRLQVSGGRGPMEPTNSDEVTPVRNMAMCGLPWKKICEKNFCEIFWDGPLETCFARA